MSDCLAAAPLLALQRKSLTSANLEFHWPSVKFLTTQGHISVTLMME
jgi:hypothetical protein